MLQYKFKAGSSLSFAVVNRGRSMYVNFSPAYRGVAIYITTDEALAEKIKAHRWFREGRISLMVEDLDKKKEKSEASIVAASAPARKPFNLMSMKVSAPAASAPVAEKPVPEQTPAMDSVGAEEENEGMKVDDVSSFMEAKEYFIANHGVARGECSSKEALSVLCERYGVVFPNYEL